MITRRAPLSPLVSMLLLVPLAVGACTLRDAGFGRACDDDDDCRGDARDTDLVCLPTGVARELRCVTPDLVESVTTGETCAEALPLLLDERTAGNSAVARNELSALCGGSDAPDVAYRIDLPARTNLEILLEADGFDGVLYASTDVACVEPIAGACVDADNTSGGSETLVLPGVGPGRLYIVVDGANSPLFATSGSFHITASEDISCDEGFVAAVGRCVGLLGEVEQVTARTNAAATLLDDGRVLLTGGRTGNALATTSSAELFDPATDTFSATGAMAIDRARHCSEKLDDGRVLVAGGVRGRDGEYDPTTSVEVFDPATGLFTPLPDLPRARDLFTCTAIPGGRGLLVAGGRDDTETLDDAWLLDPALTTWTAQEPLLEPRFGQLAFVPDFDEGDVLLVGGRVGGDARALDTVEAWDSAADDTDPRAAMNEPRAAACGARIEENDIVVFGGYFGSFADGDEIVGQASIEVYNAARDQWSSVFAEMSEPRLFATASFRQGLGVIVAGGSQDAPLASVDLFIDADTGFVALPPLRHARLAHVAVTLDDGRVLIMGGDGGDETTTVPLSAAELIGVAP